MVLGKNYKKKNCTIKLTFDKISSTFGFRDICLIPWDLLC